MAYNPNKELKLYYSISEVAQMFNVSETLLRYWEKEFPNIAPKKAGRGIRQYTKEDIEEVRSNRQIEVIEKLKAIKEELQAINKSLNGLT